MRSMAKNLAVIGDSESIKGFSAIGLDIFPCDAADNAAHLFRRIADSDNYAVIYLTVSSYEITRLQATKQPWKFRN